MGNNRIGKVRRSINRVSALLETVDLEFERVLQEREQYLGELDPRETDSTLNVDLIARVLAELLPVENKDSDEDYAALLEDLRHFGISTSGQLSELIEKHKRAINEEEASRVQNWQDEEIDEDEKERIDRGVFYTHVGLARSALDEEFGDLWDKWMFHKAKRKISGGE